VLIVEHHEPLLALFHEAFTVNGYLVLTASSGAEALAIADIHGSSIDRLVSEVMMADMDAFVLARRLTSSWSSIPVLLISGAPRSNIVERGDLNSVAGFLRKPFPLDVLLQHAHSVLNPAVPGLSHQQQTQFGNSRPRQLCRAVGSRRTKRVPTEQDVEDAIAHWQLHSGTEREGCSSSDCFCCDVVSSLFDNSPFLAFLRSILDQLQTTEASQLDALLSVYAFGLLTAEVMHERKSKSAHVVPQPQPTASISGKSASSQDGAVGGAE
jgi:CheY-like chemotaxis protein